MPTKARGSKATGKLSQVRKVAAGAVRTAVSAAGAVASRKLAATVGAAGKKAAGDAAGKTSLAAIVAEQMPGWKLVPEMKLRSPDLTMEGDVKIDTGPSIAQLRRKFLGGGDADEGVADESTLLANVNRRVKTVQIAPKTGGPAKTADIRGGKVTIVQG